jgi:hypothetical protein
MHQLRGLRTHNLNAMWHCPVVLLPQGSVTVITRRRTALSLPNAQGAIPRTTQHAVNATLLLLV